MAMKSNPAIERDRGVDEASAEAQAQAPKRVELVWDGKRTEVDRVKLPFQRIEIVNESRATREATKDSLFRTVKPGSDDNMSAWRNKLIWGENRYVLGSLLEDFAGKVDLIYIDPPFATGQDFSLDVGVGDEKIHKEASLIEEKAYRDTWGRGLSSYIQMLNDRLVVARELLSQRGSVYLHVDPRVSGYVRLFMDDVFGDDHFQNEIAWCYIGGRVPKVAYGRRHDTIFFYSKTDSWTFNWQAVMKPLSPEAEAKYKYEDDKGRYRLMGRCLKGSPIRAARDVSPDWEKKHPELVYRYYMKEGTLCLDYWDDIPPINQSSSERTGYPTQKPEDLLERLLLASSNEEDLVLDFFCGSGTTAVCAERLKRRWIACDLSRWAVQVTRKRLLDIDGCRPCEVLNLGKYERQYWQGIAFGKDRNAPQTAIHEYVKFILELYKAEAASGLVHLHGQRGGRMVHVGAADAPVTLAEIRDALEECAKIKQTKLDVLGWEWEMGLHDVVEAESRKSGVQLRLIHIPREAMDRRAVDAGDVHFYELAYLEVEAEINGRSVRLKLKNFVIPSPELIPEEVRSKVRKWSEYIDYWAVDFEYKDDVFHNQWQDYRTRAKRDLALISDWHDYDKPGERKILVKVFDIFGNDTTRLLEVRTR